ncbi:MAG: hypothetical protein R2806_10395 [Saprospiraceae bacterium]
MARLATDGLVLMLFKDSTAYRKQIPYGNSRGFILDNTGYGLHFATFNQNDILLMDGAGNFTTRPGCPTIGH